MRSMRAICSANTQNEGTVHFERGSTPYACLVGTNELAALLCVTPRTIGNLLQKRRIPVLKVGSLNRFNVQRVLEALEREETR
jgi:excisionase family DNA binding protein